MTSKPTHSRRTHFRRGAAALAASALALAACGSSGTASTTGAGGSSVVNASACGLSAFASAKKPVDISLWHQLQKSNNAWLVATINRFNSSQHDIHVTLQQLPSYADLFTKYKAGLQSGDLPTVAEFEDTTVQQLIDSHSTIPVQDCIKATGYSLSDYVPRALDFYASSGVQWSMPWAVSNVVLFYNPVMFAKAGLDPNKPPATFAEVKADSEKIVASGAAKHGIALPEKSYIFEFLLARSGVELVNNQNGRAARATAANLTSPTAEKVWTWWDAMVKSGLGLDTGSDVNSYDHLIALATGSAAMTFEASSAIGPVQAVLATGAYPGVKVSIAPLPGLTPTGGVPVADGSLWISSAAPPAERAAGWKLIEFLDTPAEQASLAAEAGYAPVRPSATKLPVLAERWQKAPDFRVSYDQLIAGGTTPAEVGPMIGDYQGVRNAVRDGFVQMIQAGKSAAAASAIAEQEANAAISAYNARIGAG